MYMSDEEKLLQVGRLAEEYSKLKGELSHVTEKAAATQRAYAFAAQGFPNIRVQGDKLVIQSQGAIRGQIPAELSALLNEHQLLELINERERLTRELKETGDRLRALAPHLL